MRRIITLIFMLLLISTPPVSAAITGLALVTNHSSTDRVIMGTNSTLNFTFTESSTTNYTNFTFPAGFGLSAVAAVSITNSTGSTITVSKSSTMINLSYTAKVAGTYYFNFTTNLTAPVTSGDYAITVKTNATSTPSTVYLYARNTSRPYYLSANNSNYTVSNETFGGTSTTIKLSGNGNANLTILAPYVSGQTNATHGWGATNASKMRVVNDSTATSLQIFVEPDPGVTDPIIIVSPSTASQTANLPAALLAVGGLSVGVYILYKKLSRKTR